MKTNVTISQNPTKTYWKDGRVTPGFTSSQDVDSTHVAWQTTNGDHRTPNAFRYWRVVARGLRGRANRLNKDSGYSHEVGGFSSGLDSDSDYFVAKSLRDSLYAAARQAALDKLTSKVRGDLDISIDLFQLKQTARLCSDLFTATSKFVATSESLRWQYLRGRRLASKDAAQLWLMYQLGIRPTVLTLYGAFEKFNEATTRSEPFAHFRGRGSRSDAGGVKIPVTAFGWQSGQLDGQWNVSVRCQFDLLLKADRNKLQKLGEWASLNPVSWGYEMVPYSFVLNYFWNLGGYLRNLESFLLYGSLFHTGSETRSEKIDTSVVNGSARWGTPTDGIDFLGFSGSHSYRLYDRSKLTSYPLPRLPVFEPKLGWQRITTLTALLLQLRSTTSQLQRKQGKKTWYDRHRAFAWWELV